MEEKEKVERKEEEEEKKKMRRRRGRDGEDEEEEEMQRRMKPYQYTNGLSTVCSLLSKASDSREIPSQYGPSEQTK